MIQKQETMSWRLMRVLVVDDDERWQRLHERNLQRWGYEVFVAQGVGQALIADAMKQAQRYQCHLALVDMCLLDDYGYDASGLGLVQQLMPTLSIMVSAYGTPAIATEAMLERGAVGFVGKQENPKHLLDVLQKALERHCLTVDSPKIVWTNQPIHLKVTGSFADDGQWSLQEVEDVLMRLFPKAQQLHVAPLLPGELLTQQAPRMRALVLKVWVDDLQPVFVKVAPEARIREEVANYEAHIHGRLLRNHHARLVDHKVLWNLGAVCYELLDVQLSGVRPFSRFFVETSSPDEIVQALRYFFEETWSGHYGRPEQVTLPLAVAYGQVWGCDLRERVGQYVGEERPLTLLSPSAPLINPLCWLYERLAGEQPRLLRQAVTHGDLHADNMMVDVHGRICVIDYERTGWGPIFQDFIELETDMVLRLTAVDPQRPIDLYELLLTLVKPTSFHDSLPQVGGNPSLAVQKTWLVIRQLRQMAYRVTDVDDMEQYLWGALLNAIFRATLLRRMMASGSRKHDAEYERALLWGSVICQRLDELGE